VQLDVALAMWDLLLPSSRWQHIEAWKDFLQTHHKRAVSRDTWNQLLEFVQVGPWGRVGWAFGGRGGLKPTYLPGTHRFRKHWVRAYAPATDLAAGRASLPG